MSLELPTHKSWERLCRWPGDCFTAPALKSASPCLWSAWLLAVGRQTEALKHAAGPHTSNSSITLFLSAQWLFPPSWPSTLLRASIQVDNDEPNVFEFLVFIQYVLNFGFNQFSFQCITNEFIQNKKTYLDLRKINLSFQNIFKTLTEVCSSSGFGSLCNPCYYELIMCSRNRQEKRSALRSQAEEEILFVPHIQTAC